MSPTVVSSVCLLCLLSISRAAFTLKSLDSKNQQQKRAESLVLKDPKSGTETLSYAIQNEFFPAQESEARKLPEIYLRTDTTDKDSRLKRHSQFKRHLLHHVSGQKQPRIPTELQRFRRSMTDEPRESGLSLGRTFNTVNGVDMDKVTGIIGPDAVVKLPSVKLFANLFIALGYIFSGRHGVKFKHSINLNS